MIGKIKCWLRRMRGGTHRLNKIGEVLFPQLDIIYCLDCGARYRKPVPLIERIMGLFGYVRTCRIIKPRGVFVRGIREWEKKGKG